MARVEYVGSADPRAPARESVPIEVGPPSGRELVGLDPVELTSDRAASRGTGVDVPPVEVELGELRWLVLDVVTAPPLSSEDEVATGGVDVMTNAPLSADELTACGLGVVTNPPLPAADELKGGVGDIRESPALRITQVIRARRRSPTTIRSSLRLPSSD